MDYYAFKIHIRCGKDSFSQYKDWCKEKKTKTDITDCKSLNQKSDNLARLQSRWKYTFVRQLDDDIIFIIHCWHIFDVVYPILMIQIRVEYVC